MQHFLEHDADDNAYLDKIELRQFLRNFFGSYRIRVPITDEYVDDVFISTDSNNDNKIQADELIAFVTVFIAKLVQEFAIAEQAAEFG